MNWLELIGLLASEVRLIWVLCGMILSWTKGHHHKKPISMALRVWAELRPFYLPAVVFYMGDLVLKGEMRGWNIAFAFCALLNWYLLKDVGDDDRWKRRKKKAVEKIKQIGSRLVVAPAEA